MGTAVIAAEHWAMPHPRCLFGSRRDMIAKRTPYFRYLIETPVGANDRRIAHGKALRVDEGRRVSYHKTVGSAVSSKEDTQI
jgi:hypothetical protein